MPNEWKSEEFDCPPGRITVDIIDEDGRMGRGIHIYYFDPLVGSTDNVEKDTMLPSKKQWEYVKPQLMDWLERNLE